MIVTWTQVLIIIHLFYQVIVNQFYVKAKILKKNRRTISEICSFKHKHPQTRNCQYGKRPCVPCKRYSQDQRLIRTRSTFSKSVIVSVGVSALGFTELIFTEPGVKISMVNFIETKVISDHIGSSVSTFFQLSVTFLDPSFLRFSKTMPHLIELRNQWICCLAVLLISSHHRCGHQTAQT